MKEIWEKNQPQMPVFKFSLPHSSLFKKGSIYLEAGPGEGRLKRERALLSAAGSLPY